MFAKGSPARHPARNVFPDFLVGQLLLLLFRAELGGVAACSLMCLFFFVSRPGEKAESWEGLCFVPSWILGAEMWPEPLGL